MCMQMLGVIFLLEKNLLGRTERLSSLGSLGLFLEMLLFLVTCKVVLHL